MNEKVTASDTGYAASKWQFDDEVTRVFDDMLERSIPQYEVMRRAVTDMAYRFAQPQTDIVDLGCARGAAIAPLVERFGEQNRFVGIELSQPMLEASRQRFKTYVERGIVSIESLDLRKEYPKASASVTLSVLTLQFVPIEHRQRVVRQIYNSTVSAGALILVEKVLGNTADIDQALVDPLCARVVDAELLRDAGSEGLQHYVRSGEEAARHFEQLPRPRGVSGAIDLAPAVRDHAAPTQHKPASTSPWISVAGPSTFGPHRAPSGCGART
jgi:tRNA (cmo5U34)-methyltransferase